MRKRWMKLLMVLAGLIAAGSLLRPDRAEGQAFDCFQTVIGCGEARIKTCTCVPPP